MAAKKILVCTNYRANPNSTSCAARGSKEIKQALAQQLHTQNVEIEIEEIQCLGHCNIGPNIRLMPNGAFFHEVSASQITRIITATKLFLQK